VVDHGVVLYHGDANGRGGARDPGPGPGPWDREGDDGGRRWGLGADGEGDESRLRRTGGKAFVVRWSLSRGGRMAGLEGGGCDAGSTFGAATSGFRSMKGFLLWKVGDGGGIVMVAVVVTMGEDVMGEVGGKSDRTGVLARLSVEEDLLTLKGFVCEGDGLAKRVGEVEITEEVGSANGDTRTAIRYGQRTACV
jgi:hypothetical protein